MKNAKQIKEVVKVSLGRPITVKVQPDMAAALKIIGKGKMATAINSVLDTYRDEIFKAANKDKKVL